MPYAIKIKDILRLALIISASFVLVLGHPAKAANDNALEGAVSSVRESIDALISAKDNDSLSPEEKEHKKFLAGQNAVRTVISLGLVEVRALKKKLDVLEIENLVADDFTFDAAETHENLSQMLSYFEAYYTDMKKRVDDLKTYEDAQNLAKDIKIWRQKVYDPGVQKILSIDLVLRSKSALKLTRNRFDKIVNDLKRLKNSKLISLAPLEPLLASATANRNAAEALNVEAANITLGVLRNVSLKPSDDSKENDNAGLSNYERISNLVAQSFAKIKDAYKKFIEINGAVKKMLGAE